LADLDVAYVDALSVCPQWQDIFINRSLEFVTTSDSPRILDCGANIGLASLWLKRQLPKARITAFEADPQICEVLRRNLRVNGCDDVEVIEAAVWDDTAPLTFMAEGTDSGAIGDVAMDPTAPAITVPAVRLRDRLGDEPIDLLKMDIEGAEEAVLADIAPMLGQVRAMQVEVHEFSPLRRRLPQCLQILDDSGFDYALDELVPATWRPEGRNAGPFARAVPAWVVLVRAWRR
jgi:FkbM family methyltransferase